MCGFVGWYSIAHRGSLDKKALCTATNLLAHRGPNDEAYYLSPSFSAGFRRLSILDLSDKGRQPMSDESGRYWLVFNGEIYNYRELRTELEQEGWAFHTATDSEVLLKGYIHWGDQCLSRLNGMFAFLIWDSDQRTLFGARDRFGEKPLYYTARSGTFMFASEIKALFPLLGEVPPFNPGIVRQYLQFGKADFCCETFFKGVVSLPAAHCFLLSGDRLQLKRYWRLEASEDFCGDPVEAFRELFLDSIRLRTRSDVPVGTCLSGGVDSGSIVCGLGRILADDNQQLTRKTFTAAFQEYDEDALVDEVNAVSSSVGFSVTPEPKGLDIIKEMLWFHDEPFHSFAAFASYEVMRLAKNQRVTVLLNGQGADEFLAGYSKFLPYYLCSGNVLGSFRIAKKAKAFSKKSTSAALLQAVKVGLQRWFSETWPFRVRAGFLQRRHASSECCLSKDFLKLAEQHAVTEPVSPIRNILKQRLENEMTGFSLPLYLRVEDRNSMAHSLESRLPFLDHRLVELVFSVPTRFFMYNGYNKYLLREAMKGILPDSVRARRTKYGFPVPQHRWMATTLRQSIQMLLRSSELEEAGVFDVGRLCAKFQKEMASPEKTDWNFWFRTTSFILWLQGRRRYLGEAADHHRTGATNPLCLVGDVANNAISAYQ